MTSIRKTRGRKRTTTYCEDDWDAIERFEDEDLWLAQLREKEREEEANKKKRIKQLLFTSELDATFQDLPPEILSQIMEFVNSARDVYHLSLTNKAFRAAVTPEVVVRAGVWCSKKKGDKSHKLLANIMEKVKKGSIRTPSTFRLLRLLTAVRCERGTECYAYDRQEQKSAQIQGFLSETRPFGLCLCKTCFRFIGEQNLLGWNTWNGIDTTRIDRIQSSILSLPENELVEKVTLDKVGPIMTATTLKQIDYTYETNEKRTTAIRKFFCDYDDQLTDHEKDNTAALIAVFDDESQLQNEQAVQKWEAKSKEEHARTEALKQRKRQLSEPVLEIIEDLLENFEHKRVVLEGDWRWYDNVRTFRYKLSQEILGNLLSAPSSATLKRITEKVDEVKEAYNFVFSCKIGCGPSDDFLSVLDNQAEPHKAAIYNYRRSLTAVLQSRSVLLTVGTSFVEVFRNGSPFEAIFSLLTFEQKRESFVHWVVQESKDERIRQGKILAKAIWGYQHLVRHETRTVDGYRARFEECSTRYSVLFQNFIFYTRTKRFKKFMRESILPAGLHVIHFTREHALEKILELKYGSEAMLEDRDWYELMALHKRMFNNPQMYHHG